jgi:hypothetical protein
MSGLSHIDHDEMAEVYRLLEMHPGGVYTKRIEWWPEPGFRVEVKCGPFPTREEADQRAWKQALELNWTAPRWWQWWRWKEDNRRAPTLSPPSP